jgi:acetolactate decarboxylase
MSCTRLTHIPAVFAVLMLSAGLVGCRTTRPTFDRITQIGYPDTAAGHTSTPSQVTLGKLLRYGGQGWGIMPEMDGHLIVLGGRPYQLRADQTVYTPTLDIRPRFATLSDFLMDVALELPEGCDHERLEQRVQEAIGSPDAFLAIRVTGRFERIDVSAPKPLSVSGGDRATDPASWTLHKVSGTMVGFRHPPSVAGVHPSGIHLVFISHDLLNGGYVRDFELVDGDVEIDVGAEYLLVDPKASVVQEHLLRQ